MKVLVACESSGIVREAFAKRGHLAMSCDLLPTEQPGWHSVGDVRQFLNGDWDMMIAFPPCTHLSVAGQWKWADTEEMDAALDFVVELMRSPIPRIAIENP